MASRSSMLKIFQVPVLISILGLLASYGIGKLYTGSGSPGPFATVITCAMLAILEITLSFDNAVVNAAVLKRMTPLWRHRFMTWGMLIAVFFMRLVFPLCIVSILSWVTPYQALILAATQPAEYARIMSSAHHLVAAFGGAFLMLVALKYFFDIRKTSHWIQLIERPLIRIGKLESVEIGIALIVIQVVARFLDPHEIVNFVAAGIAGIVTFILIDGLTALLDSEENSEHGGATSMMTSDKANLSAFLYLEVLDATFSFDGVIGAFAISNNLFVISIGLGIGAFFVRSLTIMLVENDTLARFRYLEHGAFYAIASLAAIMFISTLVEIPELVTGTVGMVLIGLAFYSSIRANRTNSRT